MSGTLLAADEARLLDRLTFHTGSPPFAAAATGVRSSTALGQGLDFHDFRHYQPGDDPRRIDLMVAARHRQLVVRQYRAEGLVRLHVLLDVSQSMTIGAPSKLECGIRLASAFSYIAAERGDALGLTTFDDRVLSHVPVAGGRRQLFRVLDRLGDVTAGGASAIDSVLQTCGSLVHGPGLAVVLSDFFDPSLTLDGVRYLMYRGLTPVLAHLVADEEVNPMFGDADDLELVDVEHPDEAPVVIGAGAVTAYRSRIRALTGSLATFCSRHGLPMMQIAASTPFDGLVSACVRAGLLAVGG